MRTNLLWKGIEYNSLENCLVDSGSDGIRVESVIVGSYNNVIYRVDYNIDATSFWETVSLEIIRHYRNERSRFSLESDGNGNWKINGNPQLKFKGCIDVDIPLTPLTNTLPVNRLKLKTGQEKIIKVLYCDLLRNEFKAVNQKYVRVSDSVYQYENVPNDFESDIQVDEHGFVVDYPQLFTREGELTTSYQNEMPGATER